MVHTIQPWLPKTINAWSVMLSYNRLLEFITLNEQIMYVGKVFSIVLSAKFSNYNSICVSMHASVLKDICFPCKLLYFLTWLWWLEAMGFILFFGEVASLYWRGIFIDIDGFYLLFSCTFMRTGFCLLIYTLLVHCLLCYILVILCFFLLLRICLSFFLLSKLKL